MFFEKKKKKFDLCYSMRLNGSQSKVFLVLVSVGWRRKLLSFLELLVGPPLVVVLKKTPLMFGIRTSEN